jgi:4-hydroxy-4-methyl-2-oxoglutarate aldolase
MKPVAIRCFERSAMATIAGLAELGVATVHEAMGRTGLLSPIIRPIQSDVRTAGSALTALVHPGDNWMLHVALDLAEPGDVLVVAVTADNSDGMFGDLLAEFAIARGVRALIIDAGVRDTAELRRMSFPVWSKNVSAKGTVKETLGSVNVPIVCAGQYVGPGDIVLADDDGVVVVPRLRADETLAAALRREAAEAEKREQLRAGVSSLDLYDLRGRLSGAGLTYVDTLDSWEKSRG